jgi:cell wall-associated NlpC family hydrolase
MEINRQKLVLLMEPTFTGHTYGIGDETDKPALGSAPDKWVKSDCSGFVRWLLFGAFGLKLPDGSWNQHAWCKKKALKECNYSLFGQATDSILRIAFIAPVKGRAGHVWLVCSGRTIESHWPNGPSRRAWDTPVLIKNVAACYELGHLV